MPEIRRQTVVFMNHAKLSEGVDIQFRCWSLQVHSNAIEMVHFIFTLQRLDWK